MHHCVHVRSPDPKSDPSNPSQRINRRAWTGGKQNRHGARGQVKSWAPAGCCTRGAAAWWRQGGAWMSVPSGSPGWPGQRWGGPGVQARWWVVGWCGWHTCRKGFQKTAPSSTLALRTPTQLPLRRDSPREPSWHKRGTHSRILKEPRHQRSYAPAARWREANALADLKVVALIQHVRSQPWRTAGLCDVTQESCQTTNVWGLTAAVWVCRPVLRVLFNCKQQK